MSFLRANIDRAIVMTQFDLRAFGHPLGVRVKVNPKYLDAITCNLVCFAAGLGESDDPDDKEKRSAPTDEGYVSYFDSSYVDYLAMCKRLVEDCDLSQKEAIQLIVHEIVKKSEEFKDEITAGTREDSGWLQPLDKDNDWGRAVLALIEAFEVSIEQTAA